MNFDVFFSICQTPVDGYMPSEREMWAHFFDQLRWADELGYGTAWVAETHLSCQVQKQNPHVVIPHFEGEIGLNTDLLQLGHCMFAQTKRIHIGSAIRNIQCNGGPMAHAEAVRIFLSLHDQTAHRERLLHLGFAAGRFPFANHAYGVRPRNEFEQAAWPVVRGKVFAQATEIFLRFLRGDEFSSEDLTPQRVGRGDFHENREPRWQDLWPLAKAHAQDGESVGVAPMWSFEKVGMVPRETPLTQLRLIIGAHDGPTQIFANQFMPVGVFNLSITPSHIIEETHQRMQRHFYGGGWTRSMMPRTVLVFMDDTAGLSENQQHARARAQAEKALVTYWRALEGTVIPERIEQAAQNALIGSPQQVVEQVRARFHPDDRLMLWFDFFNHNNTAVKHAMRTWTEKVQPHLEGSW